MFQCPLRFLLILPAAFSCVRSAWRFLRSAWALETVLVALDTADGVHEVLAKGFPVEPLRLTFRGRLELPVNVENMAATNGHDGTRGQGQVRVDGREWKLIRQA